MTYMILCDANGRRSECMLIASNENAMRVAFRGAEDVVELTRREDHWIQEGWGPVEIESFVAGDEPLVWLQPDVRYLLAG